MKAWKARYTGWSWEIKEVEYERKTEFSIWIGKRRNNIRSTWDNFLFTEQEAIDFIRPLLEGSVQHDKESLEKTENSLNRFNELYPK